VADVRLRRPAGRLTRHGEHDSRRTPHRQQFPDSEDLGRGAVDATLVSALAEQERDTSAL
jgi:hypothetical protein